MSVPLGHGVLRFVMFGRGSYVESRCVQFGCVMSVASCRVGLGRVAFCFVSYVESGRVELSYVAFCFVSYVKIRHVGLCWAWLCQLGRVTSC